MHYYYTIYGIYYYYYPHVTDEEYIFREVKRLASQEQNWGPHPGLSFQGSGCHIFNEGLNYNLKTFQISEHGLNQTHCPLDLSAI